MTFWTKSLLDRKGPCYASLCEAISDAVDRGDLRPGDKLPSHRWLATRLGVAVGTVTRALSEATKRGLIVGEVGRGTFVRHLPPKELTLVKSHHDVPVSIDLYQNLTPLTPRLETRSWLDALGAIRRSTDLATLARTSWSELSPRQQRAGAKWIQRLGIEFPPARIIPCPGLQSALCALLMTLARPGDLVLSPALAHPSIQALCDRLSLKTRGLAMDAGGLLPEAFEAACQDSRPVLLHLAPTLQSPTATTLSAARRRNIARIAKRHEVTVVEEESAAFLLPDPPPPITTFAPKNTILLADLRDGLSPGLRTLYVAAPEHLFNAIAGTVAAVSGVAAPLLAEVARQWIESDIAGRLITARRNELRLRNRIASTVFRERNMRCHPLGLHVWLELPRLLRSEVVAKHALDQGIAVTTAEWFAIGGEKAPEAIRISLGNVPTRPELRRSLARVNRLLDGN